MPTLNRVEKLLKRASQKAIIVCCFLGTGKCYPLDVYAARFPMRELNFSQAKKKMEELLQLPQRTFYCQCIIVGKVADLRSCAVRQELSIWGRWHPLDVEHVVPASLLKKAIQKRKASILLESCMSNSRQCIQKSSQLFALLEGDLHNLRFALRKVNSLRSNKKMGVAKMTSFKKGCGFKFKENVFEPPNRVKGDVARVYLYMHEKYPELKLLDNSERSMMLRWSENDPPSINEKIYNQWVFEIQGDWNYYIHQPKE